jgi:hypothetical protein
VPVFYISSRRRSGAPGLVQIRQKIKHRDTVDVVCAAVIGSISRPRAIIVGLPVNGKLRIVGRSAPLKATAAKLLGPQLQPAGPEHPWPHRVKSTVLDRFNADAGETELTLLETARRGSLSRHRDDRNIRQTLCTLH